MIKRMTAAEFLVKMANDKEYLSMQKAKDEALTKREAELVEAEAPLVEELRSAGLDVGSVWDLVNTTDSYPNAIPVLFKHLRKFYPEPVKEGIVRALTVPEARPGWNELLDFFENEPYKDTGGIKWAAACALGASADETVLAEVIRIVSDTRYGFDRVALLGALKRSESAEAKMLLHKLRADPVLGKELKKMRRFTKQKSLPKKSPE